MIKSPQIYILNCYLSYWKNYVTKLNNLWFLNLIIVSYNPGLKKLMTLKTHESWGQNIGQFNEMWIWKVFLTIEEQEH